MNKIIIMGYLGQNAEHKMVGENHLVSMSVATSKWSKKDNKAVSTWHRVNVWGKAAEKYDKLVKGARVLIEGEYLGRTYTKKDGGEAYIMEIHTWTAPIVVNAADSKPATQETDEFAIF